jgi:solute carrier family 25 (mitochondrial oxoglutarate transporter), member 11
MAFARSSALLLLLLPLAAALGPVEMMANHFLLAKAAPPPAPPQKQTSLGTRMVLGALGGMGAATVCHPLDVVRVQMQIDGGGGAAKAYKNPLDATIQIIQRKGFFSGLYTGIDAAYLRQWTYGSCRVGIYAWLLNAFTKKDKDGKSLPVPFHEKLFMGSTAGAIGSMAGLPTEVALVRMSAEAHIFKKYSLSRCSVGNVLGH